MCDSGASGGGELSLCDSRGGGFSVSLLGVGWCVGLVVS